MSNAIDLGTLDPRLRGLVRPADSRVTSGLCRALAERYRVDPLLIRLAAIGLVLAGGLGIVIYLWGTALTPKGAGEPPIRRLLPAFESWSRSTQLGVIAVTMVGTVVIHALRGSIPWGPLIIASVVAIAVWRRRSRHGQAGAERHQPWTPPTALGGSVEESLMAWRSRIAAYGARTLMPEPQLPKAEPHSPALRLPRAKAPTRAPRSWLGGLTVIGLGAAAATATFVLGLTPNLLWALVAGTAALGLTLICWSLLIRSCRIPGAVLALALLSSSATAGVASWAAEAPAPTETATSTHWAVGDTSAVIDLRNLPTDTPVTVRVVARLSNIRVLLPGAPAQITKITQLSEVNGFTDRGTPTQITLNVEATLAIVTLAETP